MYSDARYHIHGGFPHSEICGSKDIDTSPQLIAVYHVLHRLSMPRHPLNALIRLIYTHINFLNVFTLTYILFKRTSLKKIKQDTAPSVVNGAYWWRWSESNRRPHACKARALPTELHPQINHMNIFSHRDDQQYNAVGQGGLEPPTSRLSSARSNQLSY